MSLTASDQGTTSLGVSLIVVEAIIGLAVNDQIRLSISGNSMHENGDRLKATSSLLCFM